MFSTAKACRLLIESPWEFRREWLWSLAAGLPAALTATALGLALAWLVRLRPAMRLPMLMIVAALATVPSPLVAIGVIRLLNHPQDSPWNWLTHWYDYSLLAPVIVQTARALPLAVLLLWSQLATVPDSLLDAARSEGAGPLQRLWRVALPMRAAAVAICILVALLIAMSEVSGSLLVSPPGATLLSVRIFGLLHYGADDRVAALCLSVFVLLAALAGALAVCQRACRRRPGDRIESGEPRAVR